MHYFIFVHIDVDHCYHIYDYILFLLWALETSLHTDVIHVNSY